MIYNPKYNRIEVAPQSRDEINYLLSMPSRKWMSRTRVVHVPLTRMNANMLLNYGDRWPIPVEVLPTIERVANPPKPDREFPKWYTYKTQPYLHQREAAEKLYPLDASALFMQMGTGKSKVIVDMCTAHYYEKRINAVVVVCPLTVVGAWAKNEILIHSPASADIAIHFATSRFNYSKLDPLKFNWILVGVESLSQGGTYGKLEPLLLYKNCAFVVDESARIKNDKAIRTQRAIEIGKFAKVRCIASGLPVTKNLIDLYSQFEFLDTNIIGVGDYYAFRNRYAIMGGYKNKQIVGYDLVDELFGLISPHVYQITKEKALTLPPKVYEKRYVEMLPEQRDIYTKVRKGKMPGVSVKNVLERVLRLQQVISGYIVEDDKYSPTGKAKLRIIEAKDNPKIKALIEIIEDMDENEKVIVWAQHLDEIQDIVDALSPYGRVATLTGKDRWEVRTATVDSFQARLLGERPSVSNGGQMEVRPEIKKMEGNVRFIVGTQQSGGIGITLTAASTVIYYSNTNSLEDRKQSEDRAHRIGQTRCVTYIDLVMQRSVDELVLAALDAKMDLADFVSKKLESGGVPDDVLESGWWETIGDSA